MKKVLASVYFVVFVVLLAGCSITSSSSNTNTSVPASGDPWIGTWTMTSEVLASTAGDITNPATGKTIEFDSNNVFIEDYSNLAGLGTCTSTAGNYTSTWADEGNDMLSVDVPGSVEVTAPFIDCGPGANTTAVPRSIAHFSYTGDSWEITYNSSNDTITATISGPPGTTTQQFERQ